MLYVDSDDYYHWEEEILIHNTLRHPNVIQLLGVVKTEEYLYILTEYAEHGDLQCFLPKCNDFSLRVKFIQDIAKGIDWLHSNYVLHLDLKLENILVTQDLTAKIADFGLSISKAYGSNCDHFRGNMMYSAPEILKTAKKMEELKSNKQKGKKKKGNRKKIGGDNISLL